MSLRTCSSERFPFATSAKVIRLLLLLLVLFDELCLLFLLVFLDRLLLLFLLVFGDSGLLPLLLLLFGDSWLLIMLLLSLCSDFAFCFDSAGLISQYGSVVASFSTIAS